LKLSAGEQSISDLKNNPFELTSERHGVYTGMDEQIVGMRVGESKTFTTTLPEDYSNEKLAGKEAQYDVTLHKVEAKELPELDDAFAAQAGYETLEDQRKATSDKILEGKKRRVNNELRDKVVQAVIDQAQITVHPVLVNEEAEDMLHQFSHMLEQQRMSMDQYLMMMRKSREEYLKDIQPAAEERVKRQLVLDEIARHEEINITPEELEGLLRAYTQAGYNLPRSEEQLQSIALSYRREKAITRLLELTTDPDPDAEAEGEGGAEDEAASDDEVQTSSAAVEAEAGEAGEAFSSSTELE
jgi:trigger factor